MQTIVCKGKSPISKKYKKNRGKPLLKSNGPVNDRNQERPEGETQNVAPKDSGSRANLTKKRKTDRRKAY